MKIITICGSLKYQHEMMVIAEELSFKGNCILTPVYPVTKIKPSKEELQNLKNVHLKRIELSDAIFVINKDNYIGESTLTEIEYAKSLNKEIIYLENI